MDTHQFAFAIHGLGLTYPELLALHHALDTPENCIQRIKTELVSQGFEVGFNCTHRKCASLKHDFIRGQSFVRHQTQHVDCFEFQSRRIWYHEICFKSSEYHLDVADLDWEGRQFIINECWDSKRVDCGNPRQVIKELIEIEKLLSGW